MLKEIMIGGALALAASTAAAESRHGPGAMFENADANSDGMVVRDEFLAARAEHFTRMDRNSDGFIDDADRAERKEHGRHGDRGAKRRARMDADKDGKLNKEEFVNGSVPLFERLDVDHDSVLDAKELEAAKTKASRMRRHRPDQDAAQQ